MSAPDDSYRTTPTWELIDDLLDNRPEVYKRAKMELLARLANTKKEHLIELVAMEQSTPSPQVYNCAPNWWAKIAGRRLLRNVPSLI